MCSFSFLLMAPQGSGGGGNLISTLIMFSVIAGIVYLFIRSSRKKQSNIKHVKRKEHNIKSIRRNDGDDNTKNKKI